jgi:hypothetical protein
MDAGCEAKRPERSDDAAAEPERDSGGPSDPAGGVPEILPVRRVDTVTNFDSFVTAEALLTGPLEGEEEGEEEGEDEDGDESGEESDGEESKRDDETEPSGSEFDHGTYATDRCVADACAELSPVHEDSIAEKPLAAKPLAAKLPVPLPVARCDTMELLASIGGPVGDADEEGGGKRARVK